MANKLPWFTHDHDAHEDAWIRNLVRKQGHIAGWLWWVLLELHHKHGVGDVLKRDISDVAHAAMTSNSVVLRVLTEMATEFEGQSKVRWTSDGTELQLEIKKLRERLSKLKSKIHSTFLQPSFNLPIEEEVEEEGEREGEKDKTLAATPPQAPRKFTPSQKVIRGFKEAKGIDSDDKEWDRKFAARYARAANELLVAFNGDADKAIVYILVKGEEWQHLPDWGLEAVVKCAGREYLRIGGNENGSERESVGADRVDGPRSNRRYTPSGDLARDALRSLEHASVRSEQNAKLGGADDDFTGD